MCRLSMEEMEHTLGAEETGPDSPMLRPNTNDTHEVDMIKEPNHEDQLPVEVQHALHLQFRSGSDDHASMNSNPSSNSEDSLTSSPQSTIEHNQDHHENHHHYHHANHHKGPLDDHCDHVPNINHTQDDHDDAALSQSSHMYTDMLLSGPDHDGMPFFLPPSTSSSACTLEDQPTFFSSSILNGSFTSDLSLVSSSLARSTSALESNILDMNAHQKAMCLPIGTMQLMESGGFQSRHHSQILNEADHYVPYSYSSYLASSPACLQVGKTTHVDFLGAGDANGDGSSDCNMYNHNQYIYQHMEHGDQSEDMQHRNTCQAQTWLNMAMQQADAAEGGGCACYWSPAQHGLLQVMPMNTGIQTPNFALNTVELQQAAEQYYNGHNHAPMLTHSQSLPVYLDHLGSMMGPDQAGSPPAGSHVEGLGSSSLIAATTMIDLRDALRCKAHASKDQTHQRSGSSAATKLEDQKVVAAADHPSWAEGQWKVPEHLVKGTCRQSNKRATADRDDDEVLQHESCAPPLKRSASWDCVGNDKDITPSFTRNTTCKTSPSKQEKPRVRQGIANDPQSIAARHRRERISERLKILQQLVPNGSKVDLVTMLEKAINYVKFLQLQVKVLATDEYWPTPLHKFPKVAAMAKLAADSKEPANLEKVEKALAETIQAAT